MKKVSFVKTEKLADRNPIPIIPYPYTVHSPFPLVLSTKELNYPFKMYNARASWRREEEEKAIFDYLV